MRGQWGALVLFLPRLAQRRNDSNEGRERGRTAKLSRIPHSRQDLGRGLGTNSVDRGEKAPELVGIDRLFDVTVQLAKTLAQDAEVFSGHWVLHPAQLRSVQPNAPGDDPPAQDARRLPDQFKPVGSIGWFGLGASNLRRARTHYHHEAHEEHEDVKRKPSGGAPSQSSR